MQLILQQDANNILGEAVLKHPTRFIGFATLATIAPETAADELERTVKEYNFKGGIINGHIGGRYLDDDYFWPILERAEALNVPIYLIQHPLHNQLLKHRMLVIIRLKLQDY